MSHIVIPRGLPLPDQCPECGGQWAQAFTFSEPSEIRLICVQGHREMCLIHEVDRLVFELTVKPDELLRREIWIVGTDHPAPIGGMRPRDCIEGTPIRVDGEDYLVVGVEAERVWIRKV